MNGGRTDPRRQLAEIEDLIGGGTWEYDVASTSLHWSPALCRIFGIDPATFAGKFRDWFHLVHPDDRDAVSFALGEAIDRVGEYTIEHRLIRASDGAERWARTRGIVVAGDDGRPERAYGATVDITDEHRRSQLAREFLANASHELRTPASAIAQAVNVLQGPLGEEDRAHALDALARQAARLRQLTTNLIDLGRVEAGAVLRVLEPVEVRSALDDALASAPPPGGHAIDVSEVPAGLRVRAHAPDLERVLVNLLVNAWRYGGPQVTVAAEADSVGGVAITVADDGAGVAPELDGVLFEPFRRGPQRHPEASGLGLAIVEGLVRRMHGTVEYRPGAPGAVFVVSLEQA